jgi:hypothetical protein
MGRTESRPQASTEQVLRVVNTQCAHCGQTTWSVYVSRRTVSTLGGLVGLRLHVRSCQNGDCPLYHRPCRPEGEGRLALPRQEYGLDVIALVGEMRYRRHLSVPEIHLELRGRGLGVCERTVTNLLDRYDELLAVRLGDSRRLKGLLGEQGRVVLAVDGLQPDVGHEVLWVLRDCLSGEVLLAKSLLSSTEKDLAELIEQVKRDLALVGRGKGAGAKGKGAKGKGAKGKGAEAEAIPVVGVVSDGQQSIRNAVAKALPGVPHQLCQFHYLKEAGKPVYEMDRHAKKELKKRVRGIRPLERKAEKALAQSEAQSEAKAEGKAAQEAAQEAAQAQAAQAEAVLGYCSAVRSAITDDGRPPLDSSGLDLHQRLTAVSESLAKVEEKGGRRPCPRSCRS